MISQRRDPLTGHAMRNALVISTEDSYFHILRKYKSESVKCNISMTEIIHEQFKIIFIGPVPTTTEYITTDYTADDFGFDSSKSSGDSSASINPTEHDYFRKIEESTIAISENSISDLGSDTRMVTNIPYSETPTTFLPEPVKKTLKDQCKEWGDCMEVFGNTPQRKICEKMCSGMIFFLIHPLNSLTS